MTVDDSNILERYQEMFDYFVSTGKVSWTENEEA